MACTCLFNFEQYALRTTTCEQTCLRTNRREQTAYSQRKVGHPCCRLKLLLHELYSLTVHVVSCSNLYFKSKTKWVYELVWQYTPSTRSCGGCPDRWGGDVWRWCQHYSQDHNHWHHPTDPSEYAERSKPSANPRQHARLLCVGLAFRDAAEHNGRDGAHYRKAQARNRSQHFTEFMYKVDLNLVTSSYLLLHLSMVKSSTLNVN